MSQHRSLTHLKNIQKNPCEIAKNDKKNYSNHIENSLFQQIQNGRAKQNPHSTRAPYENERNHVPEKQKKNRKDFNICQMICTCAGAFVIVSSVILSVSIFIIVVLNCAKIKFLFSVYFVLYACFTTLICIVSLMKPF